MASNRNDYDPNLASDIVQTAEAKQRRQTSFAMTNSAQYLKRPAKPTQQYLAISHATVAQMHCLSTHHWYAFWRAYRQVRTHGSRKRFATSCANLGDLPVMKSYGRQVLVSTKVSTVLQCFSLVRC